MTAAAACQRLLWPRGAPLLRSSGGAGTATARGHDHPRLAAGSPGPYQGALDVPMLRLGRPAASIGLWLVQSLVAGVLGWLSALSSLPWTPGHAPSLRTHMLQQCCLADHRVNPKWLECAAHQVAKRVRAKPGCVQLQAVVYKRCRWLPPHIAAATTNSQAIAALPMAAHSTKQRGGLWHSCACSQRACTAFLSPKTT